MSDLTEDYPVKGFPIKFKWHTGDWLELFEKQVELIQNDVRRALVDDRVVIYLSCPISSSQSGGHYITNVEIARYTEQRIMREWGTGFWILNPAQYQMESKEGTGLIEAHVRLLKLEKNIDIDLAKLRTDQPLVGGDYLRMWTRILVEDSGKNLGVRFSGYYFIGPSDVRDFFTLGGSVDLTSGVEEYFARKFCVDLIFHKAFSEDEDGKPLTSEEWERKRKEFFRFYTVRASANYSKGSHDEWNIWKTLNEMRLKDPSFGVGNQISGYFDGRQIEPGACEFTIFPGYGIQG